MVNSDLKWDDHVAVITSKAGKRLWFMKQLRKACVSQDDLMFYYQSVARPIREYASPCWHLNLTKEQTKQPYDEVRRAHNIPTLAERWLDLSRTFFKRIIGDNSNVLWYLLSAKRDVQRTARLRCARQYSTIYARTNRTKSLAVTSVPFYCIIHVLYNVVCLRNSSFVKGCQSPTNVCIDSRIWGLLCAIQSCTLLFARNELIYELTHPVGDAHADNPDTESLDTPDFIVQHVDFTSWITVGDKNEDIWHVWTVSVGSVEYFRPRQSQSASRICVTATISDTSDGVPERLDVGKLIQVKLQVSLVTCRQFSTTVIELWQPKTQDSLFHISITITPI